MKKFLDSLGDLDTYVSTNLDEKYMKTWDSHISMLLMSLKFHDLKKYNNIKNKFDDKMISQIDSSNLNDPNFLSTLKTIKTSTVINNIIRILNTLKK